MTMSPVSAAVAGALISGVVMYTVGERSEKVDAFAQHPAYVQTIDGRIVPVTPAQPTGFINAQPQAMPLQPVAQQPVVVERIIERPAARQTVYRSQPVQQRVVEREPVRSGRTWQKTALVIGGSAASGAGVGGIAGGKKGALIGAAIGGGAASIYEATKRR